ncbi:AhpD family alkylhydroperoxidase [Phyllobacterium sp. P30BS-XVII]|nr:AhpD family alkylhydroperoxidase [Phyllobacterium sp. P30BS-XVII]
MIEEPIRNLGVVPTAQPNGCTFCLDIHAMQAKFGLDRSALSQRR